MRNRLVLIRLTLRRARLLLFLPLMCMYGVLPLVAFLSPANEARQTLIMTAQMLLPPGALLWSMAYLQMWIESDGQEAMRACSRGKHTCAPELLLLTVGYALALLPDVLIGSLFFGGFWWDGLYLCMQFLWVCGAHYLLSVLLYSVSMSSMLVLGYLLFCIFFSKDSATSAYCLLRLDSAAAPSLTGFLLGAALMLLGYLAERFLYRRLYLR